MNKHEKKNIIFIICICIALVSGILGVIYNIHENSNSNAYSIMSTILVGLICFIYAYKNNKILYYDQRQKKYNFKAYFNSLCYDKLGNRFCLFDSYKSLNEEEFGKHFNKISKHLYNPPALIDLDKKEKELKLKKMGILWGEEGNILDTFRQIIKKKVKIL